VNLSAIVSGAIGAVNPQVFCTLRRSTGYTIGADFSQQPTYAATVGIPCQVQALSYTDLQKIAGLNLQGTRRAVYLNGNLEGIDRPAVKGGDLLIMPNLPEFPGPTTWLVAMVLEHWGGTPAGGWVKVAVTLQNGS
jgi:hypothetical protein